jgi:hypothetical protein
MVYHHKLNGVSFWRAYVFIWYAHLFPNSSTMWQQWQLHFSLYPSAYFGCNRHQFLASLHQSTKFWLGVPPFRQSPVIIKAN